MRFSPYFRTQISGNWCVCDDKYLRYFWGPPSFSASVTASLLTKPSKALSAYSRPTLKPSFSASATPSQLTDPLSPRRHSQPTLDTLRHFLPTSSTHSLPPSLSAD